MENLLGDQRDTAVGGRIMANEEVAYLLVRWAETDEHDTIKRALANRHFTRFGCYPEYDKMHMRNAARL